MLKSIFIVFYMKGFSKWCIIFIKIIFLGISLPMGRWAICAGKQKNSLIPISEKGLLFCCYSLEFLVLTHSYSLITMGQLTDAHKAQILAYRNANLSMAEIGRKIGFSKSAICTFLSFNSGSSISLWWLCHSNVIS